MKPEDIPQDRVWDHAEFQNAALSNLVMSFVLFFFSNKIIIANRGVSTESENAQQIHNNFLQGFT